MLRKYLTGLTLAAVVTGGAFANENTVTVDIGPTIVGFAIPIVVNAIFTEGSSNGVGIAVQYERQIFEPFSVAGRFAYMGFDAEATVDGTTDQGNEVKTHAKYSPSAITIEAHARYYPFSGESHLGKAFFCDGALGYAYMNSSFSADNTEFRASPLEDRKDTFGPVDAPRNFFKFGAKVGTKIVFGDNGGFVFEQTVGWDLPLGGGETLVDKFDKWNKEKPDDEKLDQDIVDTFNGMFSALENFIFAGGPRVTLSIGWNF